MSEAWPPAAERLQTRFAAGAIALASVLLLLRLINPAMRVEDRVSPMAALAAVPDSLRREPVLNAYDYGGYLIFKGTKVFIDGRTDLFPAEFLKNDDRLDAGDRAAIAATVSRYHVAWTIFPAGSPTVKTLDQLPGWHRLYADANAVVHIKDQPPPPG